MDEHSSPSLFSHEENQEEADIWAKFMAMGQAKGLEWAKKMVAAQGVQQQSETSAVTNTDKVQPSDSGLCLLSEESVIAPTKRKRPSRAAARGKLKRTKRTWRAAIYLKVPQLLRKTTDQRQPVRNKRLPVPVGFPSPRGAYPCDEHCNGSGADQPTRKELGLQPHPRSIGAGAAGGTG
ncbi:hypothetical protein NDU88_004681 [Pleurodeles waltl]|uniref:Uncharacterized protein n=1 Tax=Pleurodeles waltl TaxID=8319 RepID=A0AAV7M7S4_PLEWA|nr:hypothetical protein NDU88_004681 [Pleurodeles waltl]